MKTLLRFSLILLVCSSYAFAQHDTHQHALDTKDVGTVEFPIGCGEHVQEEFARAVAVLHSFWYEEAERRFAHIAEDHPDCVMAYWGIAMSLYKPLWDPPSAADLDRGWAAVQKARSLPAPRERERDYVEAIAAIFQDADRLDHRTRTLAYTERMDALRQKYSDDREASVFYALALLGTALPTDKTYANQKKAGEILEPIFRRHPQHPGLAHYIIHAYDSAALGERGLDAARRYARIAPGVPHALHMPSHIFTRQGLWQESVASNRDSADAAIKYAKQGFTTAYAEQLHALDYLLYAELQMGSERNARAALDEALAVSTRMGTPMWNYARASIPVRFAIERRRWADAMELEPLETELAYSQALIHWARAIGAARSGKTAQAMRDAEAVRQLRDKLAASEGRRPFLNETEVLVRQAEGWYAFSDGRKDEALALLKEAADLEDSFEKHPVTPGAVTPAREMLADLLLELGRPAEALPQFEASLRTAPNRFNGVYGAARSAEKAGDARKAATYFAQLVELGSGREADRSELREARAWLEKQKGERAGK